MPSTKSQVPSGRLSTARRHSPHASGETSLTSLLWTHTPWFHGAVCLFLVACGGTPIENEAVLEQALAVEEQALAASCSTSDFSWPPGSTTATQVCAGPIEYGLKCYTAKADSACTIQDYQQKTCYPSCQHHSFGVQATETRSFTQTIQGTLVSSEEDCYYDIEIRKVVCETIEVWDYSTPCRNAAIAKANTWPSPHNYTGGLIKIGSYSAPNTEGAPSTCSFTLNFVPKTYNTGTGSVCGTGWSCDDTTKPIYNTCRHSSHGLAASATDCGPAKRYTAPSKSMAQAWTEAQTEWVARQTNVAAPDSFDVNDFSQPLSCTTCEDKPLSSLADNTAEAAAKYACLSTRMTTVYPEGAPPAGVDRAALTAKLVSNLKLLYEMKGHLLTQTQQEQIRGYYVSHPAAKRDCGVSFTPPSVSRACTFNRATLDAQLDMCMRLTASHVPAPAAYTGIDTCIDLADDVAALGEPLCQGEAYREAWRGAWQGVLERSVSSLKRDANLRPDHVELQAKLATLNRWYGAARQHLYPTPAGDEHLWKDTSKTFSIFWKGLYQGGLLDGSSSQLNAGVVDPFNTGLQTDAAVLAAALQPPASSTQLPLQGPPLLVLLGDGMHGLHDRIEDFSRLHDLGCRFKGCAAGAVKTEVSELWNLFGSMGDATALQAAVNNATLLAAAPSARRQEWRALFSLLQQRHLDFQNAVTLALGTGPYTPALLTQSASLPEPAVAVARLLQDGKARTQSYNASGIFLSTAHNSLHMGIQERKQQQLDLQISTRKLDLQNAIGDYQSNRNTYLNARVSEMSNTQSQQTLASNIEHKATQFSQLAEDLVGLRVNASIEEAAFSDFANSFNTLLQAEEADLDRLAIQRGPPHVFSLSAGNARFIPSNSVDDVTTFAVQGGTGVWKLSTQAGDMVNVSVMGQWSPSCALRNASFLSPSTGGYGGIGSAPVTGPEGYLVSHQNGVFSAQSNNSTSYESASFADKACAGVKAEVTLGGIFAEAFGVSMSAYASADSCMANESGWRDSSDESSGLESRTSAAYTTGIRVQGTPFPRLPAGSLLMVEVEKGSTARGAIRDIHVLQSPASTLIIGAAPGLPQGIPDPGVDVYLVVNDSATCAPDTSHSLSVSVQQLVPAGTAAVAVGKAMGKTLTHLRDSTEQFVAQGRVLPQDLNARRDAALAQLHVECAQCDLEQFPPSLMSLYNAFLSKELARMERKVEIRSVERGMQLTLLELENMANDLESAAEVGRMLRLVPAWSLRNLDGERLRDAANGLSLLVTDYLYPVIDLRYPNMLPTLKTEPKLTQLVTADWTDSYVNLSNKALDAVNSIQSGLANARISTQVPSLTKVALSFPRPGRNVAQSPWRKASVERTTALWDSLMPQDTTQPMKFSIQLTPEDLYTAIGASAGLLQCTESTPVLHRMALYFVRGGSAASGNTNLNSQFLRSATRYGSSLTFPSEVGLKTYSMENPQWLVGQSRLLFGLTTEALSAFQSQELALPEQEQTATGEGLSPFTTVTFDVTGLRGLSSNPLDSADELVVLLEVDRMAAAGMPNPLVCQ
ncbi:hypothetical protein POL68_40255 [Stigmatella sp. ncwal1]|uniref:Uncharacterized protein n=1 Tax=Stigmatella ashevillensis TaxID=2995309 RepID=A0ABT5DQT6_9BACT|nr:hypothetical protein [Stigmatella ashevillena]MDC0714752.1 hypothetical protein [Stigmatella ashevillena]